MRITRDTPLSELVKLRKSFGPQWASESAKIREARRNLSGDELKRAERDYGWFETVATAVIVITDLRRELDSSRETFNEVVTESRTEMEIQRERVEKAQREWEEKGSPDDTPDSKQGTEYKKAIALNKQYQLETLEESARQARASAQDFYNQGKVAKTSSDREHLMDHAREVLDKFLKTFESLKMEQTYREMSAFRKIMSQ